MMRRFSIASWLDAEPKRVWEAITSFTGVNHELSPWFRMTCPEPERRLDEIDVKPGERLFRSWLFLFGVLPIDYDDVTLAEIEPGRGFRERSTMLTQRAWHHDRFIEPDGKGCKIVDELSWSPRVPGAGALFAVVVPRLFAWRHARLRQRFGGRALDPS